MSRLQDAMSAVRANPKDSTAWTRLGNTLVEEGQIEKAKQSYQRALQLDPSDAAAQRGLAATLAPGGVVPSTTPPERPAPAAPSSSVPPTQSAIRGRRTAEPASPRVRKKPPIVREEARPEGAVEATPPPEAPPARTRPAATRPLRPRPPAPRKPSPARMWVGLLFLLAFPLLCLCGAILLLARTI